MAGKLAKLQSFSRDSSLRIVPKIGVIDSWHVTPVLSGCMAEDRKAWNRSLQNYWLSQRGYV